MTVKLGSVPPFCAALETQALRHRWPSAVVWVGAWALNKRRRAGTSEIETAARLADLLVVL